MLDQHAFFLQKVIENKSKINGIKFFYVVYFAYISIVINS